MTEIIQTDTILEAKNFIVLEKYTKLEKPTPIRRKQTWSESWLAICGSRDTSTSTI